MAHLKKLSDRLAKNFVPALLPIVRVGHSDTSSTCHPVLMQTPKRLLTISRRLKDYVIPSLKLTAVSLCRPTTSCVPCARRKSD